MKYRPTIGLEIHSILKTETKMFCDSPNNPEEKEPNKNTCPICLGHPGCLPTINKKAVESVLRVGLALGGTPAPVTKFDRKNYFYPDLPKGYQISQYDQPLISGGELAGVRITRIHLEEDAGRLLHEIPGETKKGEASYVDYNRAGVPLMELVTEPDIESGEQTVEFGRELQRLLRYLGVSEADMEKGQMRLEANLSLSSPADGPGKGNFADKEGKWWKFGRKVELKNINSFRFVGAAIAYEIERQTELLEKGATITQETRGWDEVKQKTFSQRSKEEAHDYRYFPEPDLPPFETSIFDIQSLKASLPELPSVRKTRFQKEYDFAEGDALRFFIDNPEWAAYFEEYVSELNAWIEALSEDRKFKFNETRSALITTGVNLLLTNIVALMKESGANETKIKPKDLARLVTLQGEGRIGSTQAKTILAKMFATGTDPEEIMKDEGLETVTDDGAVIAIVQEVMTENPNAVADFRAGKAASLQFLLGKAMGKLRGRGNPAQLKQLLEDQMK